MEYVGALLHWLDGFLSLILNTASREYSFGFFNAKKKKDTNNYLLLVSSSYLTVQ